MKSEVGPASPRLPAGIPLVRVIAMPADANPNGDIFGGWLLSQMDLAGGALVTQRARGCCATVSVDGMVFHEPVFVGDEVSCYGELVKTGRSSMTVRIEAWRRHLPSDEVRKVTEATFTYVAIDENRRPRALPLNPSLRPSPLPILQNALEDQIVIATVRLINAR